MLAVPAFALCGTMRPHRAANFRGPPFSRKIDSAEFTALSFISFHLFADNIAIYKADKLF